MNIHSRAVLKALLILGCATAQAAQAQDPQPTAVIVENVRVFDGTSDRLSAPSNVLVVGNFIKAISAAPVAPPPGTSVTRIQGGGRTLMPGLIDNHVHIFMGASSQNDMLDPKATPETLQLRAAEEAKLMLLRGFTAARDMGGPVFDIKRSIDQGKTTGPRIYPSCAGSRGSRCAASATPRSSNRLGTPVTMRPRTLFLLSALAFAPGSRALAEVAHCEAAQLVLDNGSVRAVAS